MSKIVLHVPGGGTKDIKLDRDRITIGRRADNDVWLPYPAVSAEHAAIITVLEDSFLEDLQSTNGTLVNGTRITKHFLRDHDTIDVGRVQLVYVVNEDEVVEPLPAVVPVIVPSIADEPTSEANAPLANMGQSDEDDDEPVDHLLAELMNSHGEAAVAVDIPPTVSVVPARPVERHRAPRSDATTGVYLEVMSGPNTGQIAALTKREFVLGKTGATKAMIRRDGEIFLLVPESGALCTVNGQDVPAEGTRLAFGDAIEVAGVRLRFGRRLPL